MNANDEQGVAGLRHRILHLGKEAGSAALALFLFIALGTLAVRTGAALFELVRTFRKPSADLPFWGWLQAWHFPGWEAFLNKGGRFLALFFMLLGLMRVVLWLGNRILSLHVQEHHLIPGKGLSKGRARGMIIFLSPPKIYRDRDTKAEEIVTHEELCRRILGVEGVERAALLENIRTGQAGFKHWNWQPIFVGIDACLAKGGHVVLLTSGKKGGSDQYFESARICIHKLLPVGFVHQIGGLDMFHLSEMHEGVRQALQRLHDEGVRNNEIIIDLTGATAVCSIAGLIHALERDRRALYSGNKSEGGAPQPLIMRLKVMFFDFMNPN